MPLDQPRPRRRPAGGPARPGLRRRRPRRPLARVQRRARTHPPPPHRRLGRRLRAHRGRGGRRGAAAVAGPRRPVAVGRRHERAEHGAEPLPAGERPSTSPYALDPDAPWAYRGDATVLAQNRAAWEREWAIKSPGSTFVPLFGQVWEPSGKPEVVFVSRRPGSANLDVGVATTSESGATFLTADGAEEGATSVAVVLGGDEGARRLYVVASPQVGRLEYVPARRGRPRPDAARRRGRRHDGRRRARPASTSWSPSTAPCSSRPWCRPGGRRRGITYRTPRRTSCPAHPRRRGGRLARADRARGLRRDPHRRHAAEVEEKVLFSGHDDSGRRWLLGPVLAARRHGRRHLRRGRRTAPTTSSRSFYRRLEKDPDAVAMHLSPRGSAGGGPLVVVPRPGTGQVLYSPSPGATFTPVGQRGPRARRRRRLRPVRRGGAGRHRPGAAAGRRRQPDRDPGGLRPALREDLLRLS